MKLKVGHKLLKTREERVLTQAEMADLLGISTSAYSRLERNETSVEPEQLLNLSKTLDVPVQDFLPDLFAINNSNNDKGQVGVLFGNFYSYSNDSLAQENENMREKIKFLEDKIKNLEEIIVLLRQN